MRPSYKKISLPYRKVISSAIRLLTRIFKDTTAIVLIGSIAEGGFSKESDIDLVWVKIKRMSWKRKIAIYNQLDERIQLVSFSRKQIREHFRQGTTMAHSIKNGVLLYDRQEWMSRLLQKELPFPTPAWRRQWFGHWQRFYLMGIEDRRRNKAFHRRQCRRRCYCEVSDSLARAAVNFAILYLEGRGTIPTTKAKIWRGFKSQVSDKRLRQGLKIALNCHRQDRNLSRREAEEVFYTARWLKNRLRRKI